MRMKRKFEGVWIPARLWNDKNLKVRELFVLVDIMTTCEALADLPQYTFVTNGEIAKSQGISRHQVSSVVSSLAKKGYIRVEFDENPDGTKDRTITIL